MRSNQHGGKPTYGDNIKLLAQWEAYREKYRKNGAKYETLQEHINADAILVKQRLLLYGKVFFLTNTFIGPKE